MKRLRDVAKEHRGYSGLWWRMRVWDDEHPKRRIPRWVNRIFWALQPIRCRFGFHNWYSTAAGLCSACECGQSRPYPTGIMHAYRFDAEKQRLATEARDFEYRADIWYDAYLELLQRDTKEAM